MEYSNARFAPFSDTPFALRAYFQQYEPSSNLILPGYLLPYAATSSGPVRTARDGLDYAVNALLSINVVVALVVAIILDNTVPGSKQEWGVQLAGDGSCISRTLPIAQDLSLVQMGEVRRHLTLLHPV